MADDKESQGSSAGREGILAAARLLPKARLEAFSDGVFAIVITLLVLELEVPPPEVDLWDGLLRGWPAFLGYLVSFAFSGASWTAHSNVTRFIKAADPVLLRLNLVLLLFVSFLPFTTSLMATHLNDASDGSAVVLFGLNLTLAAVLVNVLVRYSARTPGLAADDVAEEELQSFEKERRMAVVVLAAATIVGIFLPVVAVIGFLAASVLMLVEPLWRVRRRRLAAQRGSARH